MVKLLRTDTTLDLSQKARVVRFQLAAVWLLYQSRAHGPSQHVRMQAQSKSRIIYSQHRISITTHDLITSQLVVVVELRVVVIRYVLLLLSVKQMFFSYNLLIFALLT